MTFLCLIVLYLIILRERPAFRSRRLSTKVAVHQINAFMIAASKNF